MGGTDPNTETASNAERGALTREHIVRTAIQLVDQEGVAALSMRRLGAEIGVEAMALYRYIDGREDLLDAMVDAVSAPVQSAAADSLDAAGGWRAYLWNQAHHMRDLAIRHPNLFPLVATRHPAAPWLRPPLRNLDMVEEFLTSLHRGGFGPRQLALVYRIFARFLLGQLLLVAAQERQTGTEEQQRGADAVSLRHHPKIAEMEAYLAAPTDEGEEFDAALENVLEVIAAVAGEPAPEASE